MSKQGCVMTHVVIRRPFTEKAWVHAWITPCGICGKQSGTGTVFLLVLWLCPFSVIPLWLSILIYYLGDEE
jgi:hypothetical protein